jgi:hypothetical protein
MDVGGWAAARHDKHLKDRVGIIRLLTGYQYRHPVVGHPIGWLVCRRLKNSGSCLNFHD